MTSGADVARGEPVGKTGETGLAGGDHLHFSVDDPRRARRSGRVVGRRTGSRTTSLRRVAGSPEGHRSAFVSDRRAAAAATLAALGARRRGAGRGTARGGRAGAARDGRRRRATRRRARRARPDAGAAAALVALEPHVARGARRELRRGALPPAAARRRRCPSAPPCRGARRASSPSRTSRPPLGARRRPATGSSGSCGASTAGGSLVVAAQVNEPGGLRDVQVVDMTRKQLRAVRQRLAQRGRRRARAGAVARRRRAPRRGPRAHGETRERGRDYLRVRSADHGRAGRPPAEPVSRHAPRRPDERGAARGRRRPCCCTSRRSRPGRRTATRPPRSSTRSPALRDSPLVLNELQQRERVREVIRARRARALSRGAARAPPRGHRLRAGRDRPRRPRARSRWRSRPAARAARRGRRVAVRHRARRARPRDAPFGGRRTPERGATERARRDTWRVPQSSSVIPSRAHSRLISRCRRSGSAPRCVSTMRRQLELARARRDLGIRDVDRHGRLERRALAEEQVGAARVGEEVVRPRRIARVDDRPPVGLDAVAEAAELAHVRHRERLDAHVRHGPRRARRQLLVGERRSSCGSWAVFS